MQKGLLVRGMEEVHTLEMSLLKATHPDICKGVFYMCPIYSDGYLFVRYLESGKYLGFLNHTALPALRKLFQISDEQPIYPWPVYTEADVKMYAAKEGPIDEAKEVTRQYERRVASDKEYKMNKKSVKGLVLNPDMQLKLDRTPYVVFAQKRRPDPQKPLDR